MVSGGVIYFVWFGHFVIFDYILRWSPDGKFFARMTQDTLSIYETPVSFVIVFGKQLYWNT